MGRKIMTLCFLLCFGGSVHSLHAQIKAAKQQIANTAQALIGEAAYQLGADSILADKKISMGHATLRYTMKMKDRQSREWVLNFQNRLVYRMLVKQCQGFLTDFNRMTDAARKHPEHYPAVITAGTDLVLQAYGYVKQAVVVAMNCEVPLPWKVDYDDFLEGKDNTPKYKNDEERTEEETDKVNLLLPTERFKIINNALIQVMMMRTAMRNITSRLEKDFYWQKAVEYAVNFDNYVGEAQRRAFDTFGASMASWPTP